LLEGCQVTVTRGITISLNRRLDFTRAATLATLQDGPLEVKSSASVYRRERGARAAFAYARRRLVPRDYVPLALGFAVGEEARQWVSQRREWPRNDASVRADLARGAVAAAIVVTGRVGVVSAADLAPLARRQQARIQAALR
jgi:hypothetical protein